MVLQWNGLKVLYIRAISSSWVRNQQLWKLSFEMFR